MIGMEVLSCLINKDIRGSFLSSCEINGRGGEGQLISHLLHVDDTIVFVGHLKTSWRI